MRRPIKGYEKLYEVDENGHIFMLPTTWVSGMNKKIKHTKDAKKLNIHLVRGYLQAKLSKDGKQRYFKAHKLVAETFIANPNNFPQVNHKNGIKTDNRVENLEWCTAKMNINHADAMGLRPKIVGTQRYNSKLNDDKVREIRELGKTNMRQKDIAVQFGVCQEVICSIINGRYWKHVK